MFLTVSAHAGIRLETAVEPREATVGDPIQVRVSARYTPDVQPGDWPQPRELGPFEVRSFSESRPSKTENGLSRSALYTVAVFDVGISTIPPVNLSYRLADGTTGQIATPEIPVLIKSVLGPKDKDIRGIKGLPGDGWKIALIALAVLAALAGGFLFWRSRARGPGAAPGPPPRPAHEIALEALDSLEPLLTGPAKPFHSRLSDILRGYLEGRFTVSALDRTTSELFQAMRHRGLDSALCMRTREVLEICDLAKFAKWETTEEERRQDADKVRAFVMDTKPVELAPEPGDENKKEGKA